MWPLYFKDQLIAGNLESNVGICTLWTPRVLIAEKLDVDSFAVCGQLYSKDGINFILRNILANPKIRKIVVCGLDRGQAGEAFLDFVNNGINDEYQSLNTNFYAHKEIDKQALELVRNSVEVIDMRGQVKPEKIKETITNLESQSEPFSEPVVFPEPKIEQGSFPTDNSVFKIRSSTIAQAWLKILKTILKFGIQKGSDNTNSQKEILNMVSVITGENSDNEFIAPWFQFGKKELDEYYKQLMTANKFDTIAYTYGQRMRDYEGINQIEYIINDLRRANFSRRAVVSLYMVQKDEISSNPPCLVLLQALVNDGKLNLNAYFRSNEMFSSWPQNAFGLRKIHKEISDRVGIEMGTLTIISCSAHIEYNNLRAAKDIVEKYYEKEVKFCEWDPRGNIVLRLENGGIKAFHYSPDGKKIQEFFGKTAREIMYQLEKEMVVSLTAHALDLGAELQKAEIALKNGVVYNQDRE